MFVLARIIALMTLYGMPVQLFPAHSNQNEAIFPYSSRTTSPRAIKFPEQFFRHVYNKPLQGKSLKAMQYAPLHVDTKKILSPSKSMAVATTTASNGKVYNEHLEPRTHDAKTHYSKCYHNHALEHIETLPSVSRSPGHNAIYRTYPLMVPRDKPIKAHKRSQDVVKKSIPMKKILKKVNFIKPIALQQHLELLPVASTTLPFHIKEQLSPSFMTNQQYIINPDLSDKDVDIGPTKPKRPPFLPFNKQNRIHLNIARVYSPVSQKTPNYSGVYSMNVDSELAKLQADQPSVLHLSNRREEKAAKS